jgi:hypothetical protein
MRHGAGHLCFGHGRADFLVTGDRSLLAMTTFRSAVVVSPRGYLRVDRREP